MCCRFRLFRWMIRQHLFIQVSYFCESPCSNRFLFVKIDHKNESRVINRRFWKISTKLETEICSEGVISNYLLTVLIARVYEWTCHSLCLWEEVGTYSQKQPEVITVVISAVHFAERGETFTALVNLTLTFSQIFCVSVGDIVAT